MTVGFAEQREIVDRFTHQLRINVHRMGNCLLDRMYQVEKRIAERVVALDKEAELDARMKALEERVDR